MEWFQQKLAVHLPVMSVKYMLLGAGDYDRINETGQT